MNYADLGGRSRLRRSNSEYGLGVVNDNPVNLELISETVSMLGVSVRNAGRFQIIVEYSAGIHKPAAIAESPQEAVEAFMGQTPGCAEGEIALFDRAKQRVVASVKWKFADTEIGFRIPHRQNVFHDWQLGLIALEVQARRLVRADVELCA